jgi:DNA-binding transcriptional LysR family regulator
MLCRVGIDRDLNDIEVFTKVVEERSFTGAGKKLGMPRSTVSRRVAELEKRLGARLLHRTTRKLRLTEVGARYYERCASGLSAIEEAERCVVAASEEPIGRVRMTAPYALEKRLGPALSSFLAQHPQVEIDVELTQRMVDLIGDNFDLAVRATGHLPDSTLVARQLATGPARLFASPRYLKEHGTPNSPDELTEHATVAFGAHTRSWRLRDESGNEIEVPIRPRLTVNGPSLALTVAEAGFGITMLPFDHASGAIQRMVRVLPGWEGYRATLYLVYPSAKLMSATLRALRDHLLAYFADENVTSAA